MLRPPRAWMCCLFTQAVPRIGAACFGQQGFLTATVAVKRVRMEVPMKWEYRVEEVDLVAIPDAESFLNDIGGEDWELVSVALCVGGVTSHNIAFFKRPAQD
jgi:hypothetical protein